MKERLYRIWHPDHEQEEDFAGRVMSKINELRTTQKLMPEEEEEELPKTLPNGALGQKEKPRPKPPSPSTPTEIIYESEESEDEADQSPPRTPTESSQLNLSNDEDMFRSSKKKDKSDKFNLRLKDTEYDAKNRPKPKFQKKANTELYRPKKSPKRKIAKKTSNNSFLNGRWNPSNNPSPGFESHR